MQDQSIRVQCQALLDGRAEFFGDEKPRLARARPLDDVHVAFRGIVRVEAKAVREKIGCRKYAPSVQAAARSMMRLDPRPAHPIPRLWRHPIHPVRGECEPMHLVFAWLKGHRLYVRCLRGLHLPPVE